MGRLNKIRLNNNPIINAVNYNGTNYTTVYVNGNLALAPLEAPIITNTMSNLDSYPHTLYVSTNSNNITMNSAGTGTTLLNSSHYKLQFYCVNQWWDSPQTSKVTFNDMINVCFNGDCQAMNALSTLSNIKFRYVDIRDTAAPESLRIGVASAGLGTITNPFKLFRLFGDSYVSMNCDGGWYLNSLSITNPLSVEVSYELHVVDSYNTNTIVSSGKLATNGSVEINLQDAMYEVQYQPNNVYIKLSTNFDTAYADWYANNEIFVWSMTSPV